MRSVEEVGLWGRTLRLAASPVAFRILAGAALVGAVLVKTGVLPGADNKDPLVFLSATIVCLLLISEIVNERTKEIAAAVFEHGSALQALQVEIASGAHLHTLETCLVDLRRRLSEAGEVESVVVEHLGLDMTVAWTRQGA